MRFFTAFTAFLVLLSGLAVAHGQAKPDDPLHAWVVVGNDPAALEKWINQRLEDEKADLAKLRAVNGPRTVDNTLRLFDSAMNSLSIAGNNAGLLYSLADTAAMRDKGQALTSKVASAFTELSLDTSTYKALAAVPLPENDAATRHYLERTLLEYHLSGVDKDDATRAQIRALQDKITDLSLKFVRNVSDGTLKITATRAELEGLPADYIARHTPSADGVYTLTTEQPDVWPVLDFAASADLRKRMYIAYNSRAFPVNRDVLQNLLATRQQLASILGYSHYADLAVADQMIGSTANVQQLIDQVDSTSRPIAQGEYDQLLQFALQHQPGLNTISLADSRFWSEQFRRSQYTFDAQSVRPYFPYDRVQAGILDTAARLFHVSFKPVSNPVVWDRSVSVFDVIDAASDSKGKLLGRIYLDMHPREGKDKWFSSAPVVPGIRGVQLPEGMLVCNFSGGVAGDPGLMEYDEVVTFFHEFGHLMHHILGSQGQWSGQGGFNVEGDFVESPSQMLEEIFHDTAILQSFGKHYQTGETIPASMIARMNAASAYGRADSIRRQLFYASYAFDLHDQNPATLDFDVMRKNGLLRFTPYAFVDGDHFYASFTHLTGYASNYYTYVLDKVIAIDFFAQFDKRNLLDGPTAMRYRKTVLEPGASKPATELVKDFLGRPQQIDALKAWLNEEFQQQPPQAHKEPTAE